MHTATLTENALNRRTVERKLGGVRFQIDTLDRLLADGEPAVEAIESAVCGAINQMVQSLSATLYGFNAQLPDPLPTQLVNRRNLRDQFHSVGINSVVLREIENANRVSDGWLWWLEQKDAGAAFRPVIVVKDGSVQLHRDPLNLEAGVEKLEAVAYLREALRSLTDLLVQLGTLATEDIQAYREAKRRDVRRLI